MSLITVHVLAMALLMSTADAKIVFQHMDTNQTVSITAYNTLAWKTQESETEDITVQFPLIPLHEKIDGVFNPCDISTYVPGAMDSLVEMWYNASTSQIPSSLKNDNTASNTTNGTEATSSTNITNGTEATGSTNTTNSTEATGSTNTTNSTEATGSTNTTNGTEATGSTRDRRVLGSATERRWVAVYDYSKFAEACDGIYPTKMFYSYYVTYMAQTMGASAVIISGTRSPATQKAAIPPDVDLQLKQVFNVEITIPGFDVHKPEVDRFLEIIEERQSWSVDGQQMEADLNPFDGVLDPFGFVRGLFCILSLYSLCLSGYISVQMREVIGFYKRGQRSKAEKMAVS